MCLDIQVDEMFMNRGYNLAQNLLELIKPQIERLEVCFVNVAKLIAEHDLAQQVECL